MELEIILKSFLSFLNIMLIIWILNRSKQELHHEKSFLNILLIIILVIIRIIENSISIHIVYSYITIFVFALILGKNVFKYNINYSILVGSIFLSIVLIAQLLSGFFWYSYIDKKILADLPRNYHILMMISTQVLILFCTVFIKKIINKIPIMLTGLNLITILIPLFFNIVVMGVCSDQLYYERTVIIGNVWSFITIIAICFMMLAATICNITVLENYLVVKKIENEKELRIGEMSLQYDYYVKQSKDMENVRRLAHDIKNHLEALKENIDENQKTRYINGIESRLARYQSYFRTGNLFIDNLLHNKKLDAIDHGVEFKVFADFTPFTDIKDEDLCVIISNAIDNALRECYLLKKENESSESLLQIKARKIKGFLSFICENSIRDCQALSLKDQSTFESTKKDKESHGYGIKNIIDTVSKYGGEASINITTDTFCLSIIIPIEI